MGSRTPGAQQSHNETIWALKVISTFMAGLAKITIQFNHHPLREVSGHKDARGNGGLSEGDEEEGGQAVSHKVELLFDK